MFYFRVTQMVSYLKTKNCESTNQKYLKQNGREKNDSNTNFLNELATLATLKRNHFPNMGGAFITRIRIERKKRKIKAENDKNENTNI